MDGLWGTIKGIGGLVGFEGWDTLVNSWKGLGELGIGLASYQFLPPLGPGEKALPGWLRESRKTTVAAGKAMVAWDEWSKDPARAAGGVTFNVLAVLAGGGEADGVEAAGDAGKASMAARTVGALSKAGRFVDPMTYVGKGAGFAFGNLAKIPKVSVAFDALSKAKTVSIGRIGDHLTNLRTHLTDGSDIHIPAHDLIAGPDGTIHLPDGSRLTADGNYHLPDGTTATVPSEDLAHGPHASADVPGAHELVDAHVGPGGPTHAAGGLGDHAPRGQLGTHTVGHTSVTGDHPTGPVDHTDHPITHTGDGSLGHDGTGGHAGGSDGTPPPNDGTGSNHHPGDGNDDLHRALGKDPDVRTKEDQQAIMHHQVHRANTDDAYRKAFYRKDGIRLSTKRADETGQIPPHLVKDPHTGRWVAESDAPPPLGEKYRDEIVVRDRDSVPDPHGLDHLDRMAAARFHAIGHDQKAEAAMADAKKALAHHASVEHQDAYDMAKAEHSPLHDVMTDRSEKYGEAISTHHVIAEHFPGSHLVESFGPKNGNHQFDQIWKRPDGKGYVVVEAKGSVRTKLGFRTLTDGRRVMQGHPEYLDDIINKMGQRGRTNLQEAAIAKALKSARRDGKLEYILVKGNLNQGEYTGYLMRYFKI